MKWTFQLQQTPRKEMEIAYQNKKYLLFGLAGLSSKGVVMSDLSDISSVSFSLTTAILYLLSGAFFFLLIFLLVMLGVSDCHFFSR